MQFFWDASKACSNREFFSLPPFIYPPVFLPAFRPFFFYLGLRRSQSLVDWTAFTLVGAVFIGSALHYWYNFLER